MQCCAKVFGFNLMAAGATVTGMQPVRICSWEAGTLGPVVGPELRAEPTV